MASLTTTATTTKYEPLSLSKAICDSATDPRTTIDPAIIKLLNMDDVDVNENNYHRQLFTPLMIALFNRKMKLAQLLLERGDVNMNVKNHNGSTAIFFPGMCDSIEALRLLLLLGHQNYPPLDVTIKDNEGQTALDRLKQANQAEMVDLLQTYMKTGVVSPAVASRRTAQRHESGRASTAQQIRQPSSEYEYSDDEDYSDTHQLRLSTDEKTRIAIDASLATSAETKDAQDAETCNKVNIKSTTEERVQIAIEASSRQSLAAVEQQSLRKTTEERTMVAIEASLLDLSMNTAVPTSEEGETKRMPAAFYDDMPGLILGITSDDDDDSSFDYTDLSSSTITDDDRSTHEDLL